MKQIATAVAGAFLALAWASSAAAQFGRQGPAIHGVWNPVIGVGAVYEMRQAAGSQQEMQVAVVGSEPVEGKTGYWLEMMPMTGGATAYVSKMLLVVDGERTRVTRMIMQVDDQPPMEMPVMMQQDRTGQPADIRQVAELVGTENVATPAGAFSCQHYRMKNGSGDAWVSKKVPPWGLVKFTGRDATMILTRVVSGAKSHIKGTPHPFNPSEMMHAPHPG